MSQSFPVVTIIIPCFNQGNYLVKTVGSVMAQTYSDWECLIINDGSTDNTIEIAETLRLSDNRIRIINQKNKGLSGARNTGLNKARGRYIQFLDSDDILLPEKLEQQLRQLEKVNKLALSICNYYYCAENNTQKRINENINLSANLNLEEPLKDLIVRWENKGLSIPVHCFLFDSHIFNQHAITFNLKLPNHEDWDCWLSIFSLFPEILIVNEELVAYRVHSSSMSRQNIIMHRGFIKAIKLQKVKFKYQPEIFKLIVEKEKSINQRYKQHKKAIAFQKKRNSKFIKFYKENMPWPIQKLIAKFFKTI